MARIVTVGLIQDAVTGGTDATLAATIARIRDAAARGAQVICLKELFHAPYFCKALRQEYFNHAEPVPGPTTEALSAVARELAVVLVVPLYEREAPGLYRNSAVVIDADGAVLGTYRKMHIPHDPLFEEKYYFAPGDAVTDGEGSSNGFKVWKTRFGTIGVLICWDQWYPEAARLMALAGAELLLYPTAIGWDPRDDNAEQHRQRDAWITVQRGHAIANGLPLLAVNRVGLEQDPLAAGPGIQFWGSSFACGPQGELLGQAPAVLDVGTDAVDHVAGMRQVVGQVVAGFVNRIFHLLFCDRHTHVSIEFHNNIAEILERRAGHFLDAGDGFDLFLQRFGDQVFHIAGRSARIHGAHIHGWNHDVRKFFLGQIFIGRHARQHKDGRKHEYAGPVVD